MYMMREYSNDVLPNRNQGFSGRATYDYKNRYLVEFNFGYNGTERLGRQDRYEFFPAMSLGWVISNEDFWTPVRDAVDFFKIRTSFGHPATPAVRYTQDRISHHMQWRGQAGSVRHSSMWELTCTCSTSSVLLWTITITCVTVSLWKGHLSRTYSATGTRPRGRTWARSTVMGLRSASTGTGNWRKTFRLICAGTSHIPGTNTYMSMNRTIRMYGRQGQESLSMPCTAI